MRHSPRCAIFHEPPTLRDASDCNCGAIPPLIPSFSLKQAITTIEQRKHNLPYDAETVVRVDELDNVLAILRHVRP